MREHVEALTTPESYKLLVMCGRNITGFLYHENTGAQSTRAP
jgi:hypothetical protein